VPTRELGFEQQLLRDQAQLGQPVGLRAGPVLVVELGVRITPPQGQAVAQHDGGGEGIVASEQGPSLAHGVLEPGDVEGVVADAQHVAGRTGDHDGLGSVALDGLRIRAT